MRILKSVHLLAVSLCLVSACSAAGLNEQPRGTDSTETAGAATAANSAASQTEHPQPGQEGAQFVACGVSNFGNPTDQGHAVTTFGFSGDRPLSTGGDVVDGPAAIRGLDIALKLPSEKVGSRSLQLTLLQLDAQQVSVIYSSAKVTMDDTNFGFLANGGFALTQRPFNGQDAKTVYEELTRNRWTVGIGPEVATLVWADPYTENLRPFGLYWSDGEREFILIGAPASPDELIDFARAIYCQDHS